MSAELIAALLAQSPHQVAQLARGRSGGLAVPEATAGQVVAAIRRIVLAGGSGEGAPERPVPGAGLLLLAEAMVVDEHPSAADWTAGERAEAVDWVAALLERFGEDGVDDLVRVLNTLPSYGSRAGGVDRNAG